MFVVCGLWFCELKLVVCVVLGVWGLYLFSYLRFRGLFGVIVVGGLFVFVFRVV